MTQSNSPSPHLTDEEKKILETPPKGTWTLLLIFMIAAGASWLYLVFGVFASHGPVS